MALRGPEGEKEALLISPGGVGAGDAGSSAAGIASDDAGQAAPSRASPAHAAGCSQAARGALLVTLALTASCAIGWFSNDGRVTLRASSSPEAALRNRSVASEAEARAEAPARMLQLDSCAQIGCGKWSGGANCQCTTRCSSHNPPNCCPDYDGVCKLHPPQPGPGAKVWSQVVPGFNSKGVQCQEGPLPALWDFNSAGPALELKVLTYNLMWYQLFAAPTRNHNGATELIASTAQAQPYDFMGFQECEDENFLLDGAGMSEFYTIFRDRAICAAFRKGSWNLLARGHAYVAADKEFGKRAVQWLRAQHLQRGYVVYFLNHHGPIPVDTGGVCGGRSVAYELLQLAKTTAQPGDVIIITGDFNANPNSAEIQALDQGLHRDATAKADHGSLDHIYSNVAGGSALLRSDNLGSGGSDHDALCATYRLGAQGEAMKAAPIQPEASAVPAAADSPPPAEAVASTSQEPIAVRAAAAAAPFPQATGSCAAYGCGVASPANLCQCNAGCSYGCCADFAAVCPMLQPQAPAPSPAGLAGLLGRLRARLSR